MILIKSSAHFEGVLLIRCDNGSRNLEVEVGQHDEFQKKKKKKKKDRDIGFKFRS
jgi:hypothetical protein